VLRVCIQRWYILRYVSWIGQYISIMVELSRTEHWT